MSEVRVSSKYQIVIPKEARQRLNIRKGQKLQVSLEDSVLILLPVPDLPEMRGFLRGIDTDPQRDEEERR